MGADMLQQVMRVMPTGRGATAEGIPETCGTQSKVCPVHGTMLADDKPCPLCEPQEDSK